ncbi:MAG: hypothetical protein E5V36_20600, partial [Mesorhizobium sp.]
MFAAGDAGSSTNDGSPHNRALKPLFIPHFVKRLLMWQVIHLQSAGARSMEQRRSSQSFKRKELVGKLNPLGLRAFKAAADSAKLRGNPYV